MRSASAKRQGLDENLLNEGVEDYSTSTAFTEKEKALFRYVELTSRNMGQISDDEFDEIRQHVSETEFAEIGNFMLLQIGFHVFFGTLKFYPFFSPDGRLIGQEESAQIYGAEPVPLEGAAD